MMKKSMDMIKSNTLGKTYVVTDMFNLVCLNPDDNYAFIGEDYAKVGHEPGIGRLQI